MGRTVGIIAAAVVALITILLLLEIWGIVHISFLTYLRSFATWIILLGAGIAFLIIYGMFFWKRSNAPGAGRTMAERHAAKQQQGGSMSDH